MFVHAATACFGIVGGWCCCSMGEVDVRAARECYERRREVVLLHAKACVDGT
jgi:hypothetical protein